MDVSGVLGAFIALAGAGLGWLASAKLQEKKLEFDERTRFHELRVETYTRFLDTASRIMAEIQQGDTPNLAELNWAYQKIGLISGPDVRNASDRVFKRVVRAVSTREVEHPRSDKYGDLSSKFLIEARRELGLE